MVGSTLRKLPGRATEAQVLLPCVIIVGSAAQLQGSGYCSQCLRSQRPLQPLQVWYLRSNTHIQVTPSRNMPHLTPCACMAQNLSGIPLQFLRRYGMKLEFGTSTGPINLDPNSEFMSGSKTRHPQSFELASHGISLASDSPRHPPVRWLWAPLRRSLPRGGCACRAYSRSQEVGMKFSQPQSLEKKVNKHKSSQAHITTFFCILLQHQSILKAVPCTTPGN